MDVTQRVNVNEDLDEYPGIIAMIKRDVKQTQSNEAHLKNFWHNMRIFLKSPWFIETTNDQKPRPMGIVKVPP